MTRRKKPLVHGTYGGAQLHRKRGEPICDECRVAAAEYMREYRKTHPNKYAAERARQDARGRAMTRLVARHAAEFSAIYAEERSK